MKFSSKLFKCKVVEYTITNFILMIRLIPTCISILLSFYVDTQSKTPYLLTSSTHLLTTFSSSSSGSIVTPTPTVSLGK